VAVCTGYVSDLRSTGCGFNCWLGCSCV